MPHHDEIKRQFAEALHDRRSPVAQTGGARFADYDRSALGPLAQELAGTSFGCGDPLAFAQVRPGETVLDVGCGGGLDLILAAEKVGAAGAVIGVDMTEEMLALARKNIARSGYANIEVRTGAIEALPVASASVDWVISNCVLNLVPDKAAAFREVFRVLRPGGRLLISDIVASKLPWWLRRSPLPAASCAKTAVSEEKYLEIMAGLGFADAAVVARQFYAPSQLAAIVVEALPARWRELQCCGVPLAERALTRAATKVATRLWSVKLHGRKP